MFASLFKSRAKRARDRTVTQIQHGLVTISDAITVQILMVEEESRTTRLEMLTEPYFILYLFGMFAAIGARYDFEIRRKLGPEIIKMGFLGYLPKEIGISEETANSLLSEAFKAHRINRTSSAIIENGRRS